MPPATAGDALESPPAIRGKKWCETQVDR